MLKILVPTDFSEVAEYGFELALELTKSIESEIYILSIIDLPLAYPFGKEQLSIEEREKADLELAQYIKAGEKRIMEMIAPYKDNTNIKSWLYFDDLKHSVSVFLEAHEIDYVFIGSNGESSMLELEIGTNSQRMIEVSECPVITISNKPQAKKPKNIVLALDVYNEVYKGVSSVKKFTDLYGSTVHLLYVASSNELSTDQALKKLDSVAREFDFKDYTLNTAANNEIAKGIENFSNRKSIDLIALLTKKESGLAKLFSETTAEKIIDEANIPVFIYNID